LRGAEGNPKLTMIKDMLLDTAAVAYLPTVCLTQVA